MRVAVGVEMERGIPRRIASAAAREKLRTDVMDMTVDARQRLNAFRMEDRGAGSSCWLGGLRWDEGESGVKSAEIVLKMMRERGMMGRYEVVFPGLDMNHELVTIQKMTPPIRCVTSIIASGGRAFLGLLVHLVLAFPAATIVPSAFLFSAAGSGCCLTQPASTHARNPPNIIATLTITALGRYWPILRNTPGPVRT